MAQENTKYKALEPILGDINQRFISVSPAETKRNNLILQSLIDTVIAKMKEQDVLFKTMFSHIFYGGSYYDGLKIGKPEEYDLYMLLILPKIAESQLMTSNIPSYVWVKLCNLDLLLRQPEGPLYRTLYRLLDNDKYLDTKKVLAWIEGVVMKALNEYEKSGSEFVVKTLQGTFHVRIKSNNQRHRRNYKGSPAIRNPMNIRKLKVKVCKGGPALTLKVNSTVNGQKIYMDIDLVPSFVFNRGQSSSGFRPDPVASFVFNKDQWPTGFRSNPVSTKPEFFIVPKGPKQSGQNGGQTRCWRLSFQSQEREIMNDKRTLKPTIKLLKKLRDNLSHQCISSYYIKTVVLWVNETRGPEFWNNSLSYVL